MAEPSATDLPAAHLSAAGPPGASRAPVVVRDHLALALDVDDLVVARRLAEELRPWFGVVKVGLELFGAAGPAAVTLMAELGFRVFLDLKLADIPTTVGRASRVLGSLGASYLTIHAFGGVAMLRAGVEGLAEGAQGAGLAPPSVLAVTVLTSEDAAPVDLVGQRVDIAVEAGAAGVVCAASDLAEVAQRAPGLLTAVPGIRPAGVAVNDQRRAATPAEAWRAGAGLLVIGRPVTAVSDRTAAAVAITAELAGVTGVSEAKGSDPVH
jgi:orotidine-5'-phosphate decarboxylase